MLGYALITRNIYHTLHLLTLYMLRIGSIMERSEFCLLGAEGVMENGGIINKVCI